MQSPSLGRQERAPAGQAEQLRSLRRGAVVDEQSLRGRCWPQTAGTKRLDRAQVSQVGLFQQTARSAGFLGRTRQRVSVTG